MLDVTSLAKRHVFLGMQLTGRVYIGVNTLLEGVIAPELLVAKRYVTLAFGSKLCVDLQVTDDGVGGTLRFRESWFQTFVPWRAVYYVASKRGRMVWPDCAPAPLVEETADVEADIAATNATLVDPAALYAAGVGGKAEGAVPSRESSRGPAHGPAVSERDVSGENAPLRGDGDD